MLPWAFLFPLFFGTGQRNKELGLGRRVVYETDGRYSGSMVYIVRYPDAFALALDEGSSDMTEYS